MWRCQTLSLRKRSSRKASLWTSTLPANALQSCIQTPVTVTSATLAGQAPLPAPTRRTLSVFYSPLCTPLSSCSAFLSMLPSYWRYGRLDPICPETTSICWIWPSPTFCMWCLFPCSSTTTAVMTTGPLASLPAKWSGFSSTGEILDWILAGYLCIQLCVESIPSYLNLLGLSMLQRIYVVQPPKGKREGGVKNLLAQTELRYILQITALTFWKSLMMFHVVVNMKSGYVKPFGTY